jgi:hypothetical protein
MGVPLIPEVEEYVIDPMTGEKSFSGYRGKSKAKQPKKETKSLTPVAPSIPQAGLTVDEMIAGSSRDGTLDALMNDQTTGRPLPETTKTAQAPKSRLDEYMEKLMAREAGMEKQRGDDKNMALLAAGLGILGGTSPYAMANIGQGALAGVQNLREANKQRAAEQSALDKSMLYATRYQGVEDLNKQNAAYNRAMKQQQYELDVKKHGTEQQKIAINQYETHIKNAMASLDKNPVLSADPTARSAAEDKILNGITARNLYKRAYGSTGEEPQGNSFAGFSAKMR